MTDNGSSPIHPAASIVVVSYNTADHIEACLLSLLEQDYPHLEVIVVDNGSTDRSVEIVRSHFPDVELVELPDNKGFAGGASVGLYIANGDILATVNPDVVLDRGWLSAIAETLITEADIGVIGSKILYPDRKTIQHAGGLVHYPLATTEHIGRGELDHAQYDQPKDVEFVTGAALAMWADAGRSLRFFDEDYFPVYYEDVDLCWRARKEGLRVVYQPRAVAYHKESVTMDRESGRYYTYYHANRLRFVTKQYTAEQVMLQFLPSEAARISGDMPAEDRKASFALLDNHYSNNGPVAPTGAQGKVDTMRGHVDEVMKGWRVREKSFTSSVPVARRFIVRVREGLNNLSTRWYVRPILQQQVDYNAAVARTLREMAGQIAELQARVRVDAVLTAGLVAGREEQAEPQSDDVSAELEALRERVEELESVVHAGRNRDHQGVT